MKRSDILKALGLLPLVTAIAPKMLGSLIPKPEITYEEFIKDIEPMFERKPWDKTIVILPDKKGVWRVIGEHEDGTWVIEPAESPFKILSANVPEK